VFALAAAICVGRPYLGMHYPSDVVAGVVLGALIGSLGTAGDRDETA
jgi:membrane-associated phospholipid phosphatase